MLSLSIHRLKTTLEYRNAAGKDPRGVMAGDRFSIRTISPEILTASPHGCYRSTEDESSESTKNKLVVICGAYPLRCDRNQCMARLEVVDLI